MGTAQGLGVVGSISAHSETELLCALNSRASSVGLDFRLSLSYIIHRPVCEKYAIASLNLKGNAVSEAIVVEMSF